MVSGTAAALDAGVEVEFETEVETDVEAEAETAGVEAVARVDGLGSSYTLVTL